MNEFLDKTRAVRPGEELDVDRLADYLARHLPDDAARLEVEQFPAGHSNLTYLVRWGGLPLVLRRPPFGSQVKSAHDMGREFRVLSKLHAAYPCAPQVVLYCDDESILGSPFYLMHRIAGVILRRDPPAGMALDADTVRRMHTAFIDNLAALHALDYAAIGLGDLGRPEGYVRRQVEGWTKRYHGSATHDIAEVEPVSRWLAERLPTESGAALIHNDYKFDNVVLDPADPTRIIGVLDWEMATLGDPLADLGTALCYWIDADDPADLQSIRWAPTTLPGSLTRRELAARYAARTGRGIETIAYYYVLALFKTAVIAQQIYYRFHHGLTQDARFAAFLDAARIMLRAAQRTTETEAV